MLLFFLWGLFWSSEIVQKPIKQYLQWSCNGVTIFAALPKICFYTSTFQYFFSDLFCSYLQINFRNFTNFCFPENLLVAAANRFKVLKTFISLKVRAEPQATVWESLRCLGFEWRSNCTEMAKYTCGLKHKI